MTAPPALLRLGTADLVELSALEARAQPLPWSEDQLLLELLHDDARVLGLVDAGALTGYVAVRKILDEAWVLNLTVDPARRRGGLGRRLMRGALDVAAGELSCGSLWLEVRESNAPARALYLALGLEERGRRPGYYPPFPGATERETAVLMSLAFSG